MLSICKRTCFGVLIGCVLLQGFLFASAPTIATVTPSLMVVVMLWTFLAAIVALGCVWYEQLSKPGSDALASTIGMFTLIPIRRYRRMSCGGIAVADNDADTAVIAEVTPIVIIDLCAALLTPRLHLQAALQVIERQGVEVAVYSALDAWHTRAALRNAGMLEWFDYIWHMDAMKEMDTLEYAILAGHGVLSTPEQLKMKPLMTAAKVPPSKVPPWMRWLA